MKFDISKQSKEYFQEIIYMHVFLHAIAKNPKKKIYAANRYAVVSAILCFILYILSRVLYIHSHHFVFGGLTWLFYWIFIAIIFIYFIFKFQLARGLSNSPGEELVIDKDGIHNIIKENYQIQLYWSTIQYIIIQKHSIIVLPKNLAVPHIYINGCYAEQLLKAIDKYGKSELVVDNRSLYK